MVEVPTWQWSEHKRPTLSSAAKNEIQREATNKMVKDAIAAGGSRAAEFGAGMVDGVHYLQLVGPMKQLKRDGHLEEALTLCYEAIGAQRETPDRHCADSQRGR